MWQARQVYTFCQKFSTQEAAEQKPPLVDAKGWIRVAKLLPMIKARVKKPVTPTDVLDLVDRHPEVFEAVAGSS